MPQVAFVSFNSEEEEARGTQPMGPGATWCSGVLTWILFSLLQPSAFPLGTRAEDQWFLFLFF